MIRLGRCGCGIALAGLVATLLGGCAGVQARPERVRQTSDSQSEPPPKKPKVFDSKAACEAVIAEHNRRRRKPSCRR